MNKDKRDKEAESLYLKGYSLRVISHMLDISKTGVHKILLQRGVEMRSRSNKGVGLTVCKRGHIRKAGKKCCTECKKGYGRYVSYKREFAKKGILEFAYTWKEFADKEFGPVSAVLRQRPV